jgi:cell division protein FtsI/penicillin-binding protein 2
MHSAERPNPNGIPFELNLSEACWKVLKQGMQVASRQGTGKKLDPENKLKVAIKTGTTPHGTSFQSWVTGFFPWDDPRYAFVLRAPSGTSQDEAVPQAHTFLFSVEWP